MGTAQKAKPITLEDGYLMFNADGSTRLDITIPAGDGGTGHPQDRRLVERLLSLALQWNEKA